jgi:hypothetical protein
MSGEDRRLRPLPGPWRAEEDDNGHQNRESARLTSRGGGATEPKSERAAVPVSDPAELATPASAARRVAVIEGFISG